ncbi:MAG: pyruvate:ferredoxin (flavodoxin) oxidoreductase [Firmicutes bacterium]|nr:pyruvate:ferredoxin (flavodoxin) oxidoreductase [Bacillota bacterium]
MQITVDGNEAAASVAYRLNELCAIYPITPSSPMAELADEWSTQKKKNVYGSIPQVSEMQSEGGAAGALHGILQGGSLGTTFTASQGLLLMIPDIYKITGELSSTVIHVAARSLATSALSIFGDHSDVMALRQTGIAMLASASVQEAHDFAAIAQLATLKSKIPFLHFFDGFRTSHELNTIEYVEDKILREFVPIELVHQNRKRALSPEHPIIRGTSQNPDVFFQTREAVNIFYEKTPEIAQKAMDSFAELTNRSYHLVDYFGDPMATKVIVAMGSSIETISTTVKHLNNQLGYKTGVLAIRLYRPFPGSQIIQALPPSVTKIAVLDRTKEPGSLGEPLFLDIEALLSESNHKFTTKPMVIGGRYGLSSKEFTPGMVKAVFDELDAESPKRRFTVGIKDDITFSSLDYSKDFEIKTADTIEAVFYGLGSDGTVGANKNTIKILGSLGYWAQGYFVYDSKKSGSQTASHLRFGKSPIKAPYLIERASFVGCHQFNLLNSKEILERADKSATLLLNSPYSATEVWTNLGENVRKTIREKAISLYVINATKIARDLGLGSRINIILQTSFFAISNIIDRDTAKKKIVESIIKTYSKRGQKVVDANLAAIEAAFKNLEKVEIPPIENISDPDNISHVISDDDFISNVTFKLIRGEGEDLPVSLLPADGTWPTGTACLEKRNISDIIAEWDPDICIQCGNCSFVCPHSVIRSKYYSSEVVVDAPAKFKSAPLIERGLPDISYTLQIYPEDCTGCGLCVEACPVSATGNRKAINLVDKEPILTTEKENAAFFETLDYPQRERIDFSTVRGTQYLQPLFEFSGACSGCGETPYLKLVSQLFGDRAIIANATGCSSIYGGNLPTTPWTTNKFGRGPAWSNSLFEDNAEFGLGIRLAVDQQHNIAVQHLQDLSEVLGEDLVAEILSSPQATESELELQRQRIATLREKLAEIDSVVAKDLDSVADALLQKSIWIVGGDGWAYDIGSGGLDHVLASGRNVNILVLDTEVYSNTGGQMSKSTPLGSIAKFAASGKKLEKKDLALQAISYGNVYVAKVAMGADKKQTLLAFREAEAYPGPSLIIAYSHCIAHGIDMRYGLEQQYRATASGYWPLFRYDPVLQAKGEKPFLLDSPRKRIPFKKYALQEIRYSALNRSNPEESEILLKLAEEAIDRKWQQYEEMAAKPAKAYPSNR